MRTTLVINDAIVVEAKKRAAEQRTTLSAVVEYALRQTLSQPAVAPVAFSMPTFRPTNAARVNTSVNELHELLTDSEAATFDR